MYIRMGNKQFVLFMVIMLNHFQDASSQPSLSWAINLDFDADAEVPVKLMLDPSGHSYLAINSLHDFNEQNFYYLRIDPFGSIDWTDEWIASNEYEFIEDAILDSIGNGYLCGDWLTEGYLVKIDKSGGTLWEDTGGLDCKSIASIFSGKIYATFYDDAVVLIAYDSSGAEDFAVRNDTSIVGNNAYPSQVLLDPDGNAYIIGYGLKEGDVDVFIKKFNANGVFLWDVRYSPSNDWDIPDYAVIDDSCNLYILCRLDQGSQGTALAKFDSLGNLIWDRIIESSAAGNHGLIIHPNGNITRAGHGFIDNKTQYYLAQYSSSGDLIWINYIDSASIRRLGNIFQGDDGSIFFACSVYEDNIGADLISLLKYSGDGEFLWETRYEDSAYKWQAPVQLAMDTLDNIFVLAWSASESTSNDVTLLKYSLATGIVHSIQEIVKMQINPNPFSDHTAVLIPQSGNARLAALSLFDLSGKLLRSSNVAGKSNIELSREGLPNGMYLLQLKQGNQIIGTAKIVIQ